jgi:hypothetical protein
MTDNPLPSEVPHPSPPWQMTGRLWTAFVRVAADLTVPEDLTAAVSRRRLALALARYETGTLRYVDFSPA